MPEMIDAYTSQDEEMYYVTFKNGCRTRPYIHAPDGVLGAIKGKGIVVFVDKIEINNEYFLHLLVALGIY